MLGIDATHHISGAAIKASGYEFVGRYDLVGNFRITPEEIADYHANGLSIEFFGEHQADFMLGGAPAGTAAGIDARGYLESLGAPGGVVEFFTCDFDAQPVHFPAIGAFLSAANMALAPYVAGLYGGISIVEAFPGYPSHQTEAWSYGRISPHANFYQRVGTTLPPINGTTPGEYDEDISVSPVGLWSPFPEPPPVEKKAEQMIWCCPAYPAGSIAVLLAGSLVCKKWTAKPEDTVYGIPVAADQWNKQGGRHFNIYVVEPEQMAVILKANP